jgi:large subunit ribosomal protein L6e
MMPVYAYDHQIMRYEKFLDIVLHTNQITIIIIIIIAIIIIIIIIVGPYSVNKVPLRRVNQRYVIATSQKVALTGVDASKIDDKFFARSKKEDDKVLSNERKAAQTAIDTPLTANIKKVELLESYLKSNFTLKNSDKPHNLKF